MANKKITIEVTLKAQTSSGETKESSDKVNQEKSKKTTDIDSIKAKSATAAATMAAQTLDWATGELISQALFELEFQFQKTDDYVAQRNYQVATQALANARSVGNSMVSGAVTGATIGMALGPAGAVVGAVLGATLTGSETVVSKVRQGVNAMREQEFALNKMDAQLEFTRARAGYSYSTQAASIGEDL